VLTLCSQKLALTSQTSGGHSVSIELDVLIKPSDNNMLLTPVYWKGLYLVYSDFEFMRTVTSNQNNLFFQNSIVYLVCL
jgi:hypothetical protein